MGRIFDWNLAKLKTSALVGSSNKSMHSGINSKAVSDLPPIVESINKIGLRVLSFCETNKTRCPVIVLISQSTGEGVTTIAMSLARSLTNLQDGHVLLIDADQKGTRSSSFFSNGAKTTHKKVSLLILDKVPMEGTSVNKAWIAELDKLKEKFSFVVVDAGSFDSKNAHRWMRLEGGFPILVIDTMKSTEAILERLRKRLDNDGIKVKGFIMNKRPFPVPRFLYQFFT